MDITKYSEYQDFKWAVKLHRISLEIIGLWPKAKQNRREKLKCNLYALVIFLIITIGVVIPSMLSLIKIYSNILLTVDNLIYTLPLITVSLRFVVFWWKQDVIAPIVMMIMEDWLKSKDIQERTTMMKWTRSARIIIACAYCVIGIGYIMGIILPIFGFETKLITNDSEPSRSLPIQGYYIYDITQRPQYELTLIIQIISVCFGSVTYIGIDNFLGLLVFHICGQLDVLANRLTYLHKVENFYDSLKNNVTNHRRLIRAITIIEDTYNIILFVLFLYFAVLFAFYGFLLINLLENESDISIFRLAYLMSAVTLAFSHTFLYCALGELLVAYYNGIYYAVCNQEWYSLNSKDMKNLIMLLIRSSNPIYLTAGKVFPMTMSTFCSLMKTSMGYISVLLTIRN